MTNSLSLDNMQTADAKQVCVDASVGRALCEYAETIMKGRNKSGGSLIDFFRSSVFGIVTKII